ncbi:unnamed protein product [Thelazia callipaeda]|uniref:Uncharacterized protein n=1 Tax=Thelazia callipaeda TaxID=103827 RepID=A0A0N5CUJ8_THECL|nr:unnamed protein product [Thelazia callipaeda]
MINPFCRLIPELIVVKSVIRHQIVCYYYNYNYNNSDGTKEPHDIISSGFHYQFYASRGQRLYDGAPKDNSAKKNI